MTNWDNVAIPNWEDNAESTCDLATIPSQIMIEQIRLFAEVETEGNLRYIATLSQLAPWIRDAQMWKTFYQSFSSGQQNHQTHCCLGHRLYQVLLFLAETTENQKQPMHLLIQHESQFVSNAHLARPLPPRRCVEASFQRQNAFYIFPPLIEPSLAFCIPDTSSISEMIWLTFCNFCMVCNHTAPIALHRLCMVYICTFLACPMNERTRCCHCSNQARHWRCKSASFCKGLYHQIDFPSAIAL